MLAAENEPKKKSDGKSGAGKIKKRFLGQQDLALTLLSSSRERSRKSGGTPGCKSKSGDKKKNKSTGTTLTTTEIKLENDPVPTRKAVLTWVCEWSNETANPVRRPGNGLDPKAKSEPKTKNLRSGIGTKSTQQNAKTNFSL
jgi:hypothetical protein